MENPCKDCPRQGCGSYHDVCEPYNEWKKAESERWTKINKAKAFHGRDYIKQTTFAKRTHGSFKSRKKER